MRRRWHNPRVAILAAFALLGIWLLGTILLAYCDRPRVSVGTGLVIGCNSVPGGPDIDQEKLIRRLESPQFARQMENATRRHWQLFHTLQDFPLSAETFPWNGNRDLSVYSFVPRMYRVLGSRYTSVQWLQARLPLMPDRAGLGADADEANADARQVVETQVRLVLAEMRHLHAAEWRETRLLIGLLQERFEEVAFRAMEPSKGEIGIEVLGVASVKEQDAVFDWASMVQNGSKYDIRSALKMRFSSHEGPPQHISEYQFLSL